MRAHLEGRAGAITHLAHMAVPVLIAMAVACSSGSEDQDEGATTETTAQQDVEVSAEGTTIVSRGGSEVVNRFTGGSCASCHSAAEPQFDFVCEDSHGCEPLPVDDEVITAIYEPDAMVRDDSSVAEGLDAVRDVWAASSRWVAGSA